MSGRDGSELCRRSADTLRPTTSHKQESRAWRGSRSSVVKRRLFPPVIPGRNEAGDNKFTSSTRMYVSLTRVAESYLLALGTTHISSYFTKHWTKCLTHQTGNYRVTFYDKCSSSWPSCFNIGGLAQSNNLLLPGLTKRVSVGT